MDEEQLSREELENLQKTLDKDSIKYIDVTLALARQIGFGEMYKAYGMVKEVFELANAKNYQKGIHHAKLSLSIYYYTQTPSDVKKAMEFALSAHEWAKDNDDKVLEGYAAQGLGMIYWSFGNYEKGLQLTLKTLELAREFDQKEGIAWTLNSLGNYYLEWKLYEESANCFNEAYEIFDSIGYIPGKSRALNGIANLKLEQGNIEDAYYLLQKSLELVEPKFENEKNFPNIGEDSHNLQLSRIYNDIGIALRRMGELEKAKSYHEKSLNLRQQLNYPQGVTTTLMDLGDVYMELGEYDAAKKHYTESLELCEELKAKPKICRANQSLANLYRKTEDYESALKYQDVCIALENEISTEEADLKIKNLTTAFEAESTKRDAEIHRLKNVELEEALKKLSAAQARITQTGKVTALGSLAAGVFHEINNPTGSIKSSADTNDRIVKKLFTILEETNFKDFSKNAIAETKRLLTAMSQNNKNMMVASDRIHDLMKDLQNFTRVNETEVKRTDINSSIDSTLTLLKSEIDNSITVDKNYGNVPEILCKPVEINHVLMNLIRNAAKAIESSGKITISTSIKDEAILISIADTGKGIAEKQLEHIFEPGFTEKDSRVRMHTGLFTCATIIEEHLGEISAKSKVGKGTTFTFSLPIK